MIGGRCYNQTYPKEQKETSSRFCHRKSSNTLNGGIILFLLALVSVFLSKSC